MDHNASLRDSVVIASHSHSKTTRRGRHKNALRLAIAIGDYDRTQALLNGTVEIDGVDPIFMTLEPEEIFFRAFRHADFDICELSLSSYAVQTAAGTCPYIGIPAFLSRAFRHTSLYVRTDRIRTPADLKGKRVGVPEYQLTAVVWARALLAQDYNIQPSDFTWVRGGIEDPDRLEKIKLVLPSNVRIEPAPDGRSLSALLESGEIDAMITPRAPSCFDRNAPHVGWLFDDPEAVASDYFRRTEIFPIMHLLGVRRELVEEYPFLPVAVLKAFDQARALAVSRLTDVAALRNCLPFGELHVKAARDLMGSNFWSYGVNRQNRRVLDEFLAQHHAQGLSGRRLSVDDLFHPSTYEMVQI